MTSRRVIIARLPEATSKLYRVRRNYAIEVNPSPFQTEPAKAPLSVKRITTSSNFLTALKIMPKAEPKNAVGGSYDLLVRKGLIRQQSSGVYHFLPMGYRVLEKLMAIIDSHLQQIGAVKMAMPILTPQTLWNISGRWKDLLPELLKVEDRAQKMFCLGPTHEESVTNLVKEMLTSRKQLPLRLYQLDRKFRDELRPRFGLLRAREFWMKDMYTFDESKEKAMETYEEVTECYRRIFQALDLPHIKAEADTGDIGGSLSHEYLVPCEAGEGNITHCLECDLYTSRTTSDDAWLPNCPTRGSCTFKQTNGIEVAHAFYLGTKYSQSFDLRFKVEDNNSVLVEMGCYGIGVSRLLATLVEIGQQKQKDSLVWPQSVAPYLVCIVSYCRDENEPTFKRALEIYDVVNSAFPGNVILEDRMTTSFGHRLHHLKTYGYPVGIIIGNKAQEDYVEVESFHQGTSHLVHKDSLITTIKSIL